jgi:hypothetical protein
MGCNSCVQIVAPKQFLLQAHGAKSAIVSAAAFSALLAETGLYRLN